MLVGAAVVLAGAQSSGAGDRAATASSRTVVVVTTTADRVNGRVSSVAALNARPGRDGISLREALLAADHTRGSSTVYVMFAARLNGKTIAPRSKLPPIGRKHLVLEGIAPDGAPARVTIDGRRVRYRDDYALVYVYASDVTVRWLRLTHANARPSTEPMAAAMIVGPGWEGTSGPRKIAHIRIEDNVFDERGVTRPAGSHAWSENGLIICPGPSLNGKRTHIGDVTVARNEFLHYTTDGDTLAISRPPGATNSGVTIEDNVFDQNFNSIEGGGTRIIGNTITSTIPHAIGFAGGTVLPNTAIDGTVVEGNTISVIKGVGINLSNSSKGDVISNTRITNNVIVAGGDTGIYIVGGGRTSSSPSRVSGLTIENDTVVTAGNGVLLSLIANGEGASGNRISGVAVRNSIFWAPGGGSIATGQGAVDYQRPDVLENSLISGPGWAGSNGNISVDPGFTDAAAGDYHLASRSPAINAGTTTGAPVFDLDGGRRDSTPDIGAYEYGVAPRPALTVTLEQLGGGGVASSPGGIDCETTCGARFDASATVTLVARATSASRFVGWQGACTGRSRCTLTLDGDRTVIARFGPKKLH